MTRAFTLVEVVATMLVLGIISGVMLPLLLTTTETYTTASDQRVAASNLDGALARIVQLVQAIPDEDADDAPDIAAGGDDFLELDDGTLLEVSGSGLFLTTPEQAAALLCPDVQSFELTFLADDGTALNLQAGDDPGLVRRVVVALEADDIELRTVASLRYLIGGGA
ncbi:MAG: prepilin-type N-terminal cleavage/methylation domain-containing protein [Phycisphaerales bacterium]|nr:prepilin-type N-terminal cleavage/methylation domain-containing protein [Phycisphaerales bacterium]